MAKQDWAGAIPLLAKLLTRQPANAEALYDLGFCDDSLNDVEGAKAAYTRALAVDTQNVQAAVGLGLLLARNDDPAGATSALQKAVALKGDGSATSETAKAQGYRALARLQVSSSPEQSRDDLLQALRRAPETLDDVQLSGEIAEALHEDAAAEQAYARVIRATPTDPAAAVQYARVLLRQGKVAPATEVLDTALAAHPDNVALLSEKAGALLQQKDVPAALPLLERLQALQPDNTAVARLRARAYVAQGKWTEADAVFRVLAAADAHDGELMTEWADSLIRQKRDPEAQTLLERALTEQFKTPADKVRAASELAFAASANHQPELVLRAISIRNGISPLDATSAFLLATAHDSLHQSREAAGAYRQFLELANGKFPDEEWQAKQRLQLLSRTR